MPKLVYVYEGIRAEGDRHELLGVKYFGGGYEGTLGTERLWKAAGMEEVICSAEEVLRSERRNRKAQGAFSDLPVYTIPYTQIKKIAALKNHIWGL